MDDSDFIAESLKPRRKAKCHFQNETVPKPIIGSDYLLPNSDKDQCYVCNKNLKHLDELRKSLHINNCLDQQEAKNKYDDKKEKWTKTVDCPICGEPLQPGPFRAAHAKHCGQKHNVNAKSLLFLMDTQTKVTEIKKQNGIAHTKSGIFLSQYIRKNFEPNFIFWLMEPKLEVKKRPGRLNGEPRSLFDEQMKLATALSASMSSDGSEPYIETQQPTPKVRPPKQRPRSFSFVELEPRACKCAVIERVQENFLDIFKTRNEKRSMRAILDDHIQKSEKILKDTGICLRKLDRLEHLADDLKRYAENNPDITILSRENEAIRACRFIIAARAPALLQNLQADGSLPMWEYSGAAITSYINFLNSALMIWTENEREEVHSLAVKYGPPGLAVLCKSACLEAKSTEKSPGNHSEIGVEENRDSGKLLDEEEGELTETGKDRSNAKSDIINKNSEEKAGKTDELDDSSIIFVGEKISKTADSAKSVEGNTCTASTKEPGNISRKSLSEILDSGCDEIVSGSPDLFCYLPPRNGRSEKTEDSLGLLGTMANCTACDTDFKNGLGDKSDKNTSPPSAFSPLPRAVPNPEAVQQHLNDSIESLLRRLSPIKPLAPCDEKGLFPVVCCSEQLTTQDLLNNPSADSGFKRGDADSFRNLLTKTKSSPASLFKSKFVKDAHRSPILSPLSLLDKVDASTRRSCSPIPVKKKTRVEAKTVRRTASTPEAPRTPRLVQRLEELGSNVKVIKTNDITPMPNYDLMDDKELKAELAKFGIRPLGKKRGAALLKRIYEETHPVVESTPVSKKSKAIVNFSKRMEEHDGAEFDKDEGCDADKTLNRSLDEFDIMEESCMNEYETAVLPKDVDGMQRALVQWLRKEENSSLYNHLLSLNVISFEEFADRLSRADSAVSLIPKKALIEILDRLHITFRMPADGWERKRKRAKK